jgi:hypothetical protein
MHFKYDQHLDIPNGFHAAIRGVLQATLSPVWAEPLEDAVMGSYGVTVACTMAKDNDETRPSKRRKILAPGGWASTSDSMRGPAASAAVVPRSTRAVAGTYIIPSLPVLPTLPGDADEANVQSNYILLHVQSCIQIAQRFLEGTLVVIRPYDVEYIPAGHSRQT